MNESKFAIRKKQAPKRTWSAANSNVNKFAAPKTTSVVQEQLPSELELLAKQQLKMPILSLEGKNDSLPAMYRYRIESCLSRYPDLVPTMTPEIDAHIQTVIIMFPQLSNPFDSSPVFKYGKKHQEITGVYGVDGFDDSFIKSVEADRIERRKQGTDAASFVWKVYAFSGIYSVRAMPNERPTLIPGMAYGVNIVLHQGNRDLTIVTFMKPSIPRRQLTTTKVVRIGVGDVIIHQADVLISHSLKQLDAFHGWIVPDWQCQWPARPPHPLLLESIGNLATVNWVTNPGQFTLSGVDVAIVPYKAIAFIEKLLAALESESVDSMETSKSDDAIVDLLLESGHLLPVAPFMALFRLEDEDCVLLKTVPHLLIVTDSPEEKETTIGSVRVAYLSKEKGIRSVGVQ